MEAHAHVWSKNGCWCGDRQCRADGYIDKDGKFQTATVFDAIRWGESKFMRCNNAAKDGSFYCVDHPGIKGCFNCRSEECDGTRCV